jgi:O-antigen ligase
MQILSAAVAALIPLLILPGALFYFDVTPKVIVLLVGAAAALALGGLRKHELNPRALFASLPGRGLLIALAALEISLLLSTLTSSHPGIAWNGGTWRRFGAIEGSALILLMCFIRPSHIRSLLRAVALGGIMAALYGILQYFGWDPWQPAAAYRAGEDVFTIVRSPSTLGHADYFATYLVHVVFFGVALALVEQRGFWKAGGIAAAALGVMAIVLSGTRGAALGLLIGAALLIVRMRPAFGARQFVSAFVILVAAIAFYASPVGARLRARVHWSLEDTRGGARLWLWRDSLRMAEERPLTGYGPDNFLSEFPRFQSIELARAYPDFYHESPHNIFLDALTTQGALGMLGLAGLVVAGLWAGRLAGPEHARLAHPLTAALAAALVSNQFNAFTIATAFYFYLNVALLVSLAPQRGARSFVMPHYPLLAVSWLLAAIFIISAGRLVYADRTLALVKQRLAAADPSGAAEAYQRLTQHAPAGFSADLYYSRSMAQLAQNIHDPPRALVAWQQGRQAAMRATETAEERQNAWYNLAEFAAADNDAAGVERSLRAAIAASPNWFKPHWALARLLASTGRLSEAEKECVLAMERDGGKDVEVTSTLDQIRAMRRR